MYFDKHKHINYLLLVILVSLLCTCSPKFSYNIRSFLFDGVPDPYKVEVSTIKDSLLVLDSTSGQGSLLPFSVRNEFNLHTPYKKKECASCHDRDNMGTSKLPFPDLCYQCHENFNKKYKILHGPVAAGSCTQCHNPHQSKLKNLLLDSGQELCLNCHNSDMISENKVHKKTDGKSCIECHNSHGGDTKNFIFK